MLTIEKVKYLVSELATQLSLPELALDEDQCCFVAFDEQTLNIQYLREQLYLTTHIITLYQEEPITLYETVLATNLYGVGTQGGFLALEPETRALVLQISINDPTCTIDQFIDTLETFLGTANYLREQISAKQQGN